MNISKNKNGYNPRVVVSNELEYKGVKLLNENYTISSYDCNKKEIGSITFSKFYQNSGTFTDAPLLKFNVVTKSGIYRHVKSVFIDFRQDLRRVYFTKVH